ncbi:beta-galactosidase [Leifsonia shinshuensis]|uniref:beta-galactosidase n=1 Tax=Leifsonia shinshuensis TaxID=150026 RepID=UPI002862CB40|nr:beta-galactosidase [Leifsonia shinshuensis]MDR6972686.1 beta-galactosidase [Leifsonia shinshuensis]
MRFWYGADYNPEQWPEDVWAEDIRLMQEAGVTVATVGVFSWAQLEPEEGRFEFGWLDRVFELLHRAGIRVDLATATASPPPWLTSAYPEVLLTDEWGHVLSPGSRQHFNPSSSTYRRLSLRLVRALAERYGRHPALITWHIGNEFGNDNPRDFGDESAAAFRHWLQRKYATIDELNRRWGTEFWSQRYSAFEEILPPRAAPTFRNPAQLLDFDRFASDVLLENHRAEAEVLRAHSPGIPITTNFMGMFKPADYWSWADDVDFVSDDAYPDPADPGSWKDAALQRDLMRSLKPGTPWVLMEQATGAVNWRALNAPKRPDQMRALSYQAIARGADGIMFFQWRQSQRGGEKFHSGMVPHAGTDTRIWREVVQLGGELKRLEQLAGSSVGRQAVAIVADWDSWWSLEQEATPARIDYKARVSAWHHALLDLGVNTDFVGRDSDLSPYRVVIAPALFVASQSTLEALDRYVRAGGTLLVAAPAGLTDEDAALSDGGFLGSLAGTLGIRIEELAPHGPHDPVSLSGAVEATTLAWSEVVHARGADVIAVFEGGIVDGGPALTRRAVDGGVGWYLAADPDVAGMRDVLRLVLEDSGIAPATLPASVELVRRADATFVINHGSTPVTVDVAGTDLLSGQRLESPTLEPFGVVIVTGD